MADKAIKLAQMDFFRKSKAGCIFAAVAAKDPEKYGWIQKIVTVDWNIIEQEIQEATTANSVTTLSLIFPSVTTDETLVGLVRELELCPSIVLEQNHVFEGSRCLGFRVRVDDFLSWVSGFGNFEFLPETRRTPYTEITFRVKPRPNYEWTMKKSPENVIHLADLDMKGLPKKEFINFWNSSLSNTANILGAKPNLKSAAKTTFSIPEKLIM